MYEDKFNNNTMTEWWRRYDVKETPTDSKCLSGDEC